MESELVDEWRPNFRVQSNGVSPAEQRLVDKRHATLCVVLGMCVLVWCAWIKAWSGFAQLLAIWTGVSLLLGPLAPLSLTAGDCRVGQGDTVAPPLPFPVDLDKRNSRSKRSARAPKTADDLLVISPTEEREPFPPPEVEANDDRVAVDGDWTEGEVALLKKQLAKHPRGTARRWQVIADSFGGTRTVDNVILMAKSLAERKPGDVDSYAKFLAERKVSKRQVSSFGSLRTTDLDDDANDMSPAASSCQAEVNWSDSEDKALLAGLKTFPKDAPSRWESIAAKIEGRSKGQCLKRYLELREGFRSSKLRDAAAE